MYTRTKCAALGVGQYRRGCPIWMGNAVSVITFSVLRSSRFSPVHLPSPLPPSLPAAPTEKQGILNWGFDFFFNLPLFWNTLFDHLHLLVLLLLPHSAMPLFFLASTSVLSAPFHRLIPAVWPPPIKLIHVRVRLLEHGQTSIALQRIKMKNWP